MKLLKTLLWVCGIIFFISFPMMTVPWNVVENLCKWFGLPAMPADAMTVYAYRMICVLCGFIGIYFIVLATDPIRYRKLVCLTGWGLMFVGLVAIITGIMVDMKPPWYIADGGFGVLTGLLITVLYRQVLVAEKAQKAGETNVN